MSDFLKDLTAHLHCATEDTPLTGTRFTSSKGQMLESAVRHAYTMLVRFSVIFWHSCWMLVSMTIPVACKDLRIILLLIKLWWNLHNGKSLSFPQNADVIHTLVNLSWCWWWSAPALSNRYMWECMCKYVCTFIFFRSVVKTMEFPVKLTHLFILQLLLCFTWTVSAVV